MIGAKNFSEQYVLAALIEQRLRRRRPSAATREGLGSAVIFNALARRRDRRLRRLFRHDLDQPDAPQRLKPRAEVLAELAAWLEREHRHQLLGASASRTPMRWRCRAPRAQALGIRSLADLAGRAPSLSIAGDYEFFGRPEWAAVRKTYGLTFREQRQMQPDFMYQALAPARST